MTHLQKTGTGFRYRFLVRMCHWHTMATTAEMTSHGGVGVAKEERATNTLLLLLTHFRVQVAGVQCAWVRADISAGGDALLQDVVEATRRLSG